MISLRDGLITDILPGHLAKQLEVQAFAYALNRQIVKLCNMADRASIYTAIQTASEEILDYLAVELRTPCYDMHFAIETKRSLILSTLPYYMKMGTTYMVNSILRSIFGNGHILEFFEIGLEPHHFMVHISGAEATSRPSSEIREVLEQVKRKSQWLAGIVLEFDPMEQTERFGGILSTTMITPLLEQPDIFNFEDTVRVGGAFSAISSSPVPEEDDNLEFIDTVNIGGGMNTVQRTPLPEI